jgi:Na+/H+ antiporter NhaA
MECRCVHLNDETELVHFKHGALEADSEVQGSTRIPPSALSWEQRVTTSQQDQPFSGRTMWIRNLQTPLREFLRTETGGALVLLSAAIAALVWVNVDASSYNALWGMTLSIDLGGADVSLDLRHWVNSGLMTFFFFVLGLEARREFDLGELRERRRFALPLLAGIGGMASAVAIYLAFNMGSSSAHGWGIAMSTDTAFALGLLALVGRRLPDRLRTFILTVVVVDDILALIVIATVYTERVKVSALLAALGVFGVVLARSGRYRNTCKTRKRRKSSEAAGSF